jgi:CHAT domain-containing protein
LEVLDQLLAQLRLNLSAALQVGPQASATGSLIHNVQRILGRLYAVLLEPLALHQHIQSRLIIVPYGALHFLPFNLLHDGHLYLFELYEVVILPAAGLATRPSSRRKPGALVLAHSWEGRLPYTLNEAGIVQKLFGGNLYVEEAATRLAFQASPVQILHIAAHGQHRLDQPDLSYIQLADGQLYADDLFQHDLSYELVTLSACETGRAKVSGGDELIGLGRGFLYSGAGALILSLWQVADVTTLRLMELVYQALYEGLSKAAALRSAQQTILAETPGLHPAYWGGFQLIGSNNPLTPWAEPN